MVDPNTRQGKRTPVTLKIKFKSETLEQFIERYAVDVSQGGIFIRTKEPLSVGTQMKFEFQLRDASPLIAGEGTVVWTRENDPSRPAIAPGMGVRFDRLADGSQGILERILTEKAKQAPQRPNNDTAKPPMFTDTPTRVAPAPVQEALLGKDRSRRTSDEPNSDSHTPLPKPMPFHSDADEFPDEAFEEATKVRALDELIAQTAEGGSGPAAALSLNGLGGLGGLGGLSGSGNQSAASAAHAASAANAAANAANAANAADDAVTRRNGRVESTNDGDRFAHEAPGLPSPPESSSRPLPKLLDASPSPRIEGASPAFVSESMSRTRLGVEPARTRSVTPGPGSLSEAPPLPSGMRAVATETTEPARMPAAKNKSIAPVAIFILLLIAAGGAAVWFFVIRPQALEHRGNDTGPGSQGSALVAGSAATGSAATTVGSSGPAVGSAGSAATGSAGVGTPSAPKGELVDTVIGSSAEGAIVTIAGTDQTGPAPFTAKLEKGKPYKARIAAKGFASLELDVKGGDDKQIAKLVAKPHLLDVTTDPPGALISVDSSSTGHTTPFKVELTAAQAAKKTVRLQLRKSGFKTIDRTIELAKMTEDDTQMSVEITEKLSVQTYAATPPGPITHTGSGAGSAKPAGAGSDAGSGAAPDGAGSAAPPTPPTPPPATPPATPPAAGGGGSAEPEPSFKQP